METIGEDAFMSTGISNNGWNTAFIPQSLQSELVPDTYGSHLKQHKRWVSISLRFRLSQVSATNCELSRNLVVWSLAWIRDLVFGARTWKD